MTTAVDSGPFVSISNILFFIFRYPSEIVFLVAFFVGGIMITATLIKFFFMCLIMSKNFVGIDSTILPLLLCNKGTIIFLVLRIGFIGTRPAPMTVTVLHPSVSIEVPDRLLLIALRASFDHALMVSQNIEEKYLVDLE